MAYLSLVSLLWAFSFGLIKRYLAGVDPVFLAWVRLLISFLVFLPFLRIRNLDRKTAGRFFLLGGVQFGLMYVAYLAAFRYLSAGQVALFTVFTPFFVTLLEDLRRRRFHSRNLAAALLAILGAAVIVYEKEGLSARLSGFMLVQFSNFCFAFGQVFFRAIMKKQPGLKEHRLFALSYLGALVAVAVFWIGTGGKAAPAISGGQAIVLLYLGAIASGLGFFLWNRGALRVGAGTLAAFNNLKIPLAVIVSLMVFGEKIDFIRLLAGGGIITAVLLWHSIHPKKTAGQGKGIR